MECSTPRRVQGQIGPDFEQPGFMEGFPAHGRGVGTKWPLKVPSKSKPFDNSMNKDCLCLPFHCLVGSEVVNLFFLTLKAVHT